MIEMYCPACGARQPRNDLEYCVECDAFLHESAHASIQSGSLEDQTLASESNEWIAALKSHYEQNTLPLSQEWLQRLRRMWTGVQPGHRRATVVFIDLCEYTRMSNRLRPDQMHAIRQSFYDICLQCVSLHGGFIVKFMGDGVFAAFGAPHAFDRDSESAIRAILDARDELEKRSQELGLKLALHAGAATGLVDIQVPPSLKDPQPDLFGPPVNLAWRLLHLAVDHEIFVTDDLALALGSIFEFKPREPFTPKNYDREVVPHEALGLKPEGAPRRPHRFQFVGREQELNLVGEWLEMAPANLPRIAFAKGEPGIGKSRYVEETLIRNEYRFGATLRLDCEPHEQHIPFGVLRRLARAALHRISPTPYDLQRASQHDLIRRNLWRLQPETLAPLAYLFGEPETVARMRGLPGQEITTGIIGAVHDILTRLAKPQTICLFIDDIQWCDPLSLDFLRLFAGIDGLDAVLFLIGRPAHQFFDDSNVVPEINADQVREALGPDRLFEITLEPLDNRDARNLLSQILDWDRLPPQAREYFTRDLEANPNLLIECALLYKRKQAQAQISDGASISTAELPMTLYELIQARIDNLDTLQRRLLQHAAVLGRRFQYSFLNVFRESLERLQDHLMALYSLRILRRESLDSTEYVAFASTMMRDLVYDSLSDADREATHRRTAMHLESAVRRDNTHEMFELAYHWIRAGELEQGARYLLQICPAMIGMGGALSALRTLRDTIQRFDRYGDEDNPILFSQKVVCLKLAARAARELGDYSSSDQYLEQFLELAQQKGNAKWLTGGRLEQCQNLFEVGRLEEAESRLGALEMPNKLIDRKRSLIGMIQLQSGRLNEARDNFLETLNSEDGGLRGDMWNNLGLVHWQNNDLVSASAAFDNAIEERRRQGDLFGEVATRSNMGIIFDLQGRFVESRETYELALRKAEEIGYLRAITALESNLSYLNSMEEQWETAQSHASRALHVARMINHPHSESIALENLGVSTRGAGPATQAVDLFEQAAQIGARLNDPERVDSPMLESAMTHLIQGDTALARSALNRVSQTPTPDNALRHRLFTSALLAVEKKNELEVDLNFVLSANAGLPAKLSILDLWLALDQKHNLPANDILSIRRQLTSQTGE